MTARNVLILAAAGIASLAVAVGIYFNDIDRVQVAESSPETADVTDIADLGATSASSGSPAGDIIDASQETVSSDDRVASLAWTAASDTSERQDPQITSSESLEDPSIITLSPEVDALPIARSAFLEGEHEVCAAVLGQAAAADDDRFDVYYLMGLSQRKLGQVEESATSLERAVEIAPSNVRAHVNLARSYIELDRTTEARQHLTLASELAPRDGDVWNVMGRVELSENDFAAAETVLKQAVEINPKNPYAFNNLGLALLQTGHFRAAAEALEVAVELKSDVAYFHNNLGLVYENLGELDKALASFQVALSLQPEHEKARVSMARVEPLAATYVANRTESAGEDVAVETNDEGMTTDEASMATDQGASGEDVAVKPE